MSIVKDSNDVALIKAIEENDINRVRELLHQNVDQNYDPKFYESLIFSAIRKKQIEIIKLLIENNTNVLKDKVVKSNLIKRIFKSKNFQIIKELVSCIIELNNDVRLIQLIFEELTSSECQGNLAMEIFRILLDNGLPIHDFIEDVYYSEDGDRYTPLHVCINENRMDFVSLLLERGADIHKKTGLGMSCLWVSVWSGIESIIKLLVEKGVKINERLSEGKTALHRACITNYAFTIYLLFKYGADPNISDDYGNTPLIYAWDTDTQKAMVEELAKLKFENKPISPQNLAWLQDDKSLLTSFESCLKELQKFKDKEVYNGTSLYEIIKTRKYKKKLIFLAKNEDFLAAFKSSRNCDFIKHYGKDLDDIFGDVVEKKSLLEAEEKKLYSIFKDLLPELVVNKIVYYLNEHLFFD